MRIFIRSLTGKVYDLEVSPDSSISELKAILHKVSGLPESEQALLYSSQLLNDQSILSMTLQEQSGAVIQLVPILSGGGQIIIKLLSGKIIKVDVDFAKENVTTMKQKIYKLEHIPVSDVKLVFKANPLINSTKLLKDYGVKEGDTVYAIATLPG